MEVIEVAMPAPIVQLTKGGKRKLQKAAHECLQHAYRYAIMLTKEELAKGTRKPTDIANESLELYEHIYTIQGVFDQLGLETEDTPRNALKLLEDVQKEINDAKHI